MSKFRCEYTYNRRFDIPRHSWNLIGPKGGMHLHIAGPYTYSPQPEFSAGLETHARIPPDYMRDQAPSHDHCWLLKCPCWHDGTSLYANDHYVPLWLSDQHNHDGMFARLEHEYARRFEAAEE